MASLLYQQVKPGSYFLRMRMGCEFDVNLTLQLLFRCDIPGGLNTTQPSADFVANL